MRLTLALIVAATLSHAQSFVPGTIQNRDSTQQDGLIKFIPHTETGSEVIFRPADGSGDLTLTAEELLGFTVKNGSSRFLSFRESRTGNYVFAEVQNTGAVTVLRLEELYIFSKDDRTNLQMYLPLSKMMYEDKKDYVTLKAREIRAIGGFSEFLKDCEVTDLQARLRNIGIEKIRKVLDDYNACKGTTMTRTGRPSIRAGLIAGVAFPNMTFLNDVIDKFDAQLSYFGGLDLDFIPRSYHSKFNINLGATYSKVTIADQPGSPLEPLKWNLSHTRFNLPLSLKMYGKPGQSGFFAQPGIQYSRVFSTGTNSDFVLVNENMAYVFLGLGWEQNIGGRNWISASVRYELNVMSPFKSYYGDSNLRSLQATVGYRVQWGL
jgi:hypothetical protein